MKNSGQRYLQSNVYWKHCSKWLSYGTNLSAKTRRVDKGNTYIFMYVRTYVCMYVCINTNTHTHAQTDRHTHTQAYTQAHTYTYVHDMHACNGFSYWQKHRIYAICRKIDAIGDNHSKRIKSAAEKHYTFCIHGYYILYNHYRKSK